MSRRWTLLAVALLAAFAALSISPLARRVRTIPPDAVVLVDGEPLTLADLRGHLRKDGKFKSVSEAMSWTSQAVDFFLLAREDKRQGGPGNAASASRREEDLALQRNPVGSREIEKEYQRRDSDFVHPPRAWAEYLSFPLDDDPDLAASKMEKAFVLVQVAHGGASRAAVARSALSSEARITNAGPFPCGDAEVAAGSAGDGGAIPSEVREAACRLRDGVVSLPIRSQDGRSAFVIAASWKQRERNLSVEEASPELRDELERKIRIESATALSRRLRNAADVEILKDNVTMLMVRDSGTSSAPSDAPPGLPGPKEVQRDS